MTAMLPTPPRPFALERFYARWEFAVAHNLSASDVEPIPLRELLELADADSLRLWETLSLGYTETLGHPLLRETIAGLYEEATADDILVCAGAEEGILLAIAALAGPGGERVHGVADVRGRLGARRRPGRGSVPARNAPARRQLSEQPDRCAAGWVGVATPAPRLCGARHQPVLG
jgi:hypothetical protein